MTRDEAKKLLHLRDYCAPTTPRAAALVAYWWPWYCAVVETAPEKLR